MRLFKEDLDKGYIKVYNSKKKPRKRILVKKVTNESVQNRNRF